MDCCGLKFASTPHGYDVIIILGSFKSFKSFNKWCWEGALQTFLNKRRFQEFKLFYISCKLLRCATTSEIWKKSQTVTLRWQEIGWAVQEFHNLKVNKAKTNENYQMVNFVLSLR